MYSLENNGHLNPGTNLRLKYLPLRSSQFQGLQDV